MDPSRLLTAIVHRHTGATADFVHVYRAGQAAGLQWLAGGVVEVTAEGGVSGEGFARRVRLAGQAGLELDEADRK
ncbi:hypothetical protein [Paenibacillus sp. 1P03SA]|uniref:hypothetical protein n=1 Tax=Paenibacillus sp. 1P03SA TaxID=3132294 RepID=UPI0039A22BCD